MRKINIIDKQYLKNLVIGFLVGVIPFLILKIVSKGSIISFIMIFSFFGLPGSSGFFYLYGLYIFGLMGILIGFVYSLVPQEKKRIYFGLILIISAIYILFIFISIIISVLLGPEPINILG